MKSVLILWQVSSWSESAEFLVRLVENSNSWWGSFWEQSPVISQFSKSLFWDVLRTVPEHVRTCGFRRKLSGLDRVPIIRDSVPLNCWDTFLVIQPSISSKTRVMYSSVIPGMFSDWLFLAFSCVSLGKAAKFRFFLEFPLLWKREKLKNCEDWFDFLFAEWKPFQFDRENVFNDS